MSRETGKPKVLVICDYYLPGFKSGGGMRTIVNTVDRLSDAFEFWILTRDHDGRSDTAPYPGISYKIWNDVGEAKVRYLHQSEVSFESIRRAIADVTPSVVYLNSFFSSLTFRTLLLRKWRANIFPAVIVAPCGELSPGALNLKPLKKKIYITLLRALGLAEGVRWKASSESESAEMRNVLGREAAVSVATDLPGKHLSGAPPLRGTKSAGVARLVFLSRISPKKNLEFLIRAVREAGECVTLDVYGEADDPAYESRCRECAAGFSGIRFNGPLPHEMVEEALASYDFFALPTLNENFGHVIVESLSAGTPVILSDATPWASLESSGAGRIIPLQENTWSRAFEELAHIGPAVHSEMSSAARRVAEDFLEDKSIEVATRRLLHGAGFGSPMDGGYGR